MFIAHTSAALSVLHGAHRGWTLMSFVIKVATVLVRAMQNNDSRATLSHFFMLPAEKNEIHLPNTCNGPYPALSPFCYIRQLWKT